MGKAFAALLAIITLASVYFFAARTWWMPVDISAHGPGVDHQIIETMLLTGVLFLLSQLALAGFVWKFGGPGEGRRISTFPGGAKVVVFAVFVVVGIEILTLSFFGSKVWAGMFFAPAAPNSLHIDVQAELELHHDHRHSARARRRHLAQSRNLAELPLERRRHRRRDHIRTRPRIKRQHLHRRIIHFGKSRYGKLEIRDSARKKQRRHQ